MTTSPSAATIRPARPDDTPKIADLIAPFVRVGKLLPRSTAEIRDLIATAFVADCGGAIIGFAALEIYSNKLAEIRSLAVIEGRQGHGLGSELVNACVALAGKRNILEVMVITSTEDFFRGCGFDFTLPGEKKALFIQPPALEGSAS